MKKIFSLFVILLSFSIQGFAQQYINLYQDDVVIKQYSTEEIDSMSITETEPRIISFWCDGEAFQTYNAADIDSIKVTNRGGAPFAYIGIIGFNSQLNKKEIGILSPATASQYKSFVNNLPKQDGTVLYYAVDNALDMLDEADIESPLKSVNVITFTDGLDQGSLMKTDKYGSLAEYLNGLGDRIAQTRIEDLPINAYSVGLRGSDVTNVSQFKQNLQRLASSEEKAFEVSSISALRSKFQDIANQIISVSTRQTMSVRVPGVDNGTRMRFVFDGKAAASSELYIEGTFDLQDRSLHDVTYHGIKATSGKTVQGTQDDIFLTYTFTGMRPETGTSLIPTSSVKHYLKDPSATSWQVNSEFTPTGNTQRNVSHSGTSIMLVLDCSSSLGSDFSSMQSYANEFINLIASNAEPFELVTPKNVKAQLDADELVVNVSWDEVKYAQTYNIYRNSSSGGTYQLVAEGVTTNAWTDESPLKGYNYYKVCAVNRKTITSQSSYASANVTLDTPANVNTALIAKDNKLVISVSWSAVKYAQHYKVYRSSSYYGDYELVADGLTSTTWTDETPLNDNNYYKVSAFSHGIESGQSDYSYMGYKLNAPTNVRAQVDDNALIVHVAWDAVRHADSYNVYRSSSDNGIYTLIAEGVMSTSWTDNSPMQGVNYYKVCAKGYGFTSPQSAYATANIILDTPANVQAALDDSTPVVHVSWSSVKYGQSYNVYRHNSSGGTYELVAENITATSWTDNSPLEGFNYYKVSANGYGYISAQSSYVSVNVKLDAPTNVNAGLDDNALIVNVSWNVVKYAQSYKVYRSDSSNGIYEMVAENVTATSWTDNSPQEGNNYYKVCAVGYGFTSAQSSSVSVYVKLDAPTNVTAKIDDNSLVVNVSWASVKYGQSYKVFRSNSSTGTYELVAENVTATSWTDNNPLEGYNYYKACAVGYGFTSAQSSYVSVNVKLDAPANVKAELNGNDWVVNVSWNAVKYGQSYKVYRSNSSTGTYEMVAENVTATSWTDNSPLEGYNYYKVCTVGYGFTSAQSSSVYIIKLNAPANVKAEMDANDLVVNVSWASVKYGQSYKVFRSNSSNGIYELVAENVTTTSWTDNSPLEGYNYYKVCAVGYGFTSAQSSNVSVYVKLELDAPTNIKAQLDAHDLVVNVSWDAVKYAQNYNVYRSNSSSGTYQLVAGVVEGGSSSNSIQSNTVSEVVMLQSDNVPAGYQIDGSSSVEAYSYSSDLCRDAKLIKEASGQHTITLPANAKVTKIVMYAVGDNNSADKGAITELAGKTFNVSLPSRKTGTAFATATVENVELTGSITFTVTYAAGVKFQLTVEQKETTGISSNTWTDNSPLEGYNYYKVCAVNQKAISAQSSYASVNVKLDSPTNVKTQLDKTDWVVNVSWGAVIYAQSYNIYRSNSSNGTYQLVAENVASASWTDNSPLDDYNYYKVKALSKGFESELSNAVGVEVSLPFVDLGLPSRTLWAKCNIGASTPNDYGDYFAWGDTNGYKSGKHNFSWFTYKWGSESSLTKYNFNDNKTELDLEDDAAYVNWGPKWRMPSKDQFEELINSSYTTTEWTTLNGVKGRKITSKKNGNSIFLPAEYRYVEYLGSYYAGEYWSRTFSVVAPPIYTYRLLIQSSGIDTGSDTRCYGHSVRPVRLSE